MASKVPTMARVADVTTPALSIFGSADPDFPSPTEESAWIASQIDSTSVIIDGAGHYPHVEYPEQVASGIAEFAASLNQNADRIANTSTP